MRFNTLFALAAAAAAFALPAVAAPQLDDRLDLMLSCGATYILYSNDKSVATTEQDAENLRNAGIMMMNEVEKGLAGQDLTPEELQKLGATRTEAIGKAMQANKDLGFDQDKCTELLNEVVAAADQPAPAAGAEQPKLLTGADTGEILNAARGHGSAELTKQDNGDPLIKGKVDGVSYYVLFRNCTNNANCEDLNFYTAFADVKPGLEKINEWNATKRFSRAYLDSDQDATIEMDLDLAAGVTSDYMDKTFGLWTLVLGQFSSFVGYK